MSFAYSLSRYTLVLLATAIFVQTSHAQPAPSKNPKLEGKVVLANLDRYAAHIKVGKNQKQIAPRKASVLSPKKFPVTIEYWKRDPRARRLGKNVVSRSRHLHVSFSTGQMEFEQTSAAPQGLESNDAHQSIHVSTELSPHHRLGQSRRARSRRPLLPSTDSAAGEHRGQRLLAVSIRTR